MGIKGIRGSQEAGIEGREVDVGGQGLVEVKEELKKDVRAPFFSLYLK